VQKISLEVQKYKQHLRLSIPDRSIRDDLKLKVSNGDIIIVQIIEIVEKGSFFKDVPCRGVKNGRT
jgi:hypothetical protein